MEREAHEVKALRVQEKQPAAVRRRESRPEWVDEQRRRQSGDGGEREVAGTCQGALQAPRAAERVISELDRRRVRLTPLVAKDARLGGLR